MKTDKRNRKRRTLKGGAAVEPSVSTGDKEIKNSKDVLAFIKGFTLPDEFEGLEYLSQYIEQNRGIISKKLTQDTFYGFRNRSGVTKSGFKTALDKNTKDFFHSDGLLTMLDIMCFFKNYECEKASKRVANQKNFGVFMYNRSYYGCMELFSCRDKADKAQSEQSKTDRISDKIAHLCLEIDSKVIEKKNKPYKFIGDTNDIIREIYQISDVSDKYTKQIYIDDKKADYSRMNTRIYEDIAETAGVIDSWAPVPRAAAAKDAAADAANAQAAKAAANMADSQQYRGYSMAAAGGYRTRRRRTKRRRSRKNVL